MEDKSFNLTEAEIREAISKIAGVGNGYGRFGDDLIFQLNGGEYAG